MNSGIYQIINIVDGKKYIGSAVNLKYRWNKHRRDLRKNEHHSVLLQRAWNKYGEDSFSFSEIEFVNKDDLISKEQFYLNTYDPEYNICKTAGSLYGFKFEHSDATKRKIGLSNKGKKRSKEYIQKMSIRMLDGRMKDENHPMFGRHHSVESKEKMRLAKIGKPSHMKGRHLSEETKRKLSLARKEHLARNR